MLSYRIAQIPKKDGTCRLLEIPSEELKIEQRKILESYLYRIGVHKTCHGFTKHRSPVTNAKVHLNSKIIIKLDIKDFFSSSKHNYVYNILFYKANLMGIFRDVPNEVSNLTKKLTFNGHLPTGAPTSPAIANILMYHVDKMIYSWCRNRRLRYTRYADDITISSTDRITKNEIKNIISYVRFVLKNQRGYKLKRDKIRVFSKKDRMEVTGVVVNTNKASVSKKYRNNIRAAIHQAKTKEDIEKIKGKISWVRQVQPKHAKKLSLMLSEKVCTLQKKS